MIDHYFNCALRAYLVNDSTYLFGAELWMFGDAFSRAFFCKCKREVTDQFVLRLFLMHFEFSVWAEGQEVASEFLLAVAFLPSNGDLGRVKGI